MVTGCLPGKNCFSRLFKSCQLHIVTLLLGTEEGGLKRDYGRSLKEVEEKENDTSEHFHFNGFAIVYVHLHMMLVVKLTKTF